ncbi:leucine carboxyl methyltransferase [Karstenula rhodostoma CBS 690.94]|uniref:Leucine carboxyl methyltransferase 1 n=1 Tax=Karstenula rhodostoma CBS 690.94 TaxID=1392251 RepID=A0A9P4PMK2_9PLEO|nr:leucine carboxyl methyltransferase [Karstenula rhodostoma CBS 690.94]
MSSSNQIPNLKTLLGRGRGGGLRGRARGGPGASSAGSEAVRDNAVRGTDQDAAGSRVSCVELGYLDDPYAKLFATQPSTRRLPLLNRGSYVRTTAIDTLIDRFLTTPTPGPKQIVSLGAGTDTRYFRLRDKHPNTPLIYHELDFPANAASKLLSIHRSPDLQDALDTSHLSLSLSPPQQSYHSPTYNLHALDLRTLATPDPATLPDLPNLNPTAPTLILSEMCLVYLHAPAVKSILHALTTHYLSPAAPASLVLYEPIRPNDAFGRTMIANLATRNIILPTLTAYPELADQRARLRGYGFVGGGGAVDTGFVWREWVGGEEKERVAGLEMLDEMEELELFLKHYSVCWGWRDGDAEGEQRDVFRRAWAGVKDHDGG